MAAILVVDDDLHLRDTLYELFSDDHLCHSAETAEQALNWLRSETYDVILTDISMPGMSGLELLARIRELQLNSAIIVMSGIHDDTYKSWLKEFGVFDYVMKPFDLADVEEIVSRAIKSSNSPHAD